MSHFARCTLLGYRLKPRLCLLPRTRGGRDEIDEIAEHFGLFPRTRGEAGSKPTFPSTSA